MPNTRALGAPAARRGRPRKFTAPARPVTITLPDHVIDALHALDPDLGRAIVRLAQPVLADRPHPPAELATFGRHSVIVVNPTRTLERRTGVELLHLPDGRALISFDQTKTIPALELLIDDALEDPSLSDADREVFDAIASILKSARRSKKIALLERNVIVLETRRAAAPAALRPSRRSGQVKSRFPMLAAIAALAPALFACGGSKTTPTNPTPVNATLSAPKADSPSSGTQLDTLRPTLTVQNVTSDQPTGARTYEFQISDTTSFTAATTQSVNGFAATVGKTGVPEGAGKTSFTVDSDLQPTTMFYWRARAIQGTVTGPWSETFQFKSKLVGFNRAGELYDPLIHGETIGTIVGSASFVPGKGLQLNNGTSYVKYLLAATITNGEFSMDIEGLRANGPGDKAKVFGMQEGQDDFITNRYRVDIQYRGVQGFPPNAITFRAVYGDGDDLGKRYEPDTNTRLNSVYNLNPANTYFWKAIWGSEMRVTVRDGGVAASAINGNVIYNVGMASLKGTYSPSSHYAYLGAPVGRSGTESASIGGAIYRNVYIGSKPRPDTLGSALR